MPTFGSEERLMSIVTDHSPSSYAHKNNDRHIDGNMVMGRSLIKEAIRKWGI